MTDESPEIAPDLPTDLIVEVLSPAWGVAFEKKVADLRDDVDQLRDNPGGALTPEQEEQILSALRNIDQRLVRHRTDIELLKTRFNDLINYVVQSVPVSQAPTPETIPADEAGAQ